MPIQRSMRTLILESPTSSTDPVTGQEIEGEPRSQTIRGTRLDRSAGLDAAGEQFTTQTRTTFEVPESVAGEARDGWIIIDVRTGDRFEVSGVRQTDSTRMVIIETRTETA